ncbi:MAG: SpoIIE family protein phosphatase [Oscillospiraceae bacterium]
MSKTNDLCTDIGYMSLNHAGETLCGDHVEVAERDGVTIIVLADGLGSGVKANILSILTTKIISTMLAAGLKLEDAVETIAAALPVCSVRGIAYSTFTVIRIDNGEQAEIMQYDNPSVILLRDGKSVEIPAAAMQIGGKTVYHSLIALKKDDVFVAMSDGVEHAGIGGVYNFGWKREDIISFLETFWSVGFTAKTLTTILLGEANKLYDGKPGDDATVCTVRIRAREPANVLFGPPASRDDNSRMLALFFAKEGKHIICGGTTSGIASEYLKKPIRTSLVYHDPNIPPTAELEGVDLVTEGVVTMNRVLDYAKDYLEDNRSYTQWCYKKDGASQLARLLFEEATDINFFVGRAVNPAHQSPDLPVNFNIKMKLVEELTDCLEKMGKKVKVLYF